MELIKDLDTQWAEKFTSLKREQQAYVDNVRRAVKVRRASGVRLRTRACQCGKAVVAHGLAAGRKTRYQSRPVPRRHHAARGVDSACTHTVP